MITFPGLVFSQVIKSEPTVVPTEDPALHAAQSLSISFEKVADIATPSLVNISSIKKTSGPGQLANDPFREFFGEDFMERFFQPSDFIKRTG